MLNEQQTRIITNRTTHRVERVDVEEIIKMRRNLFKKSYPGTDVDKRFREIIEKMKW